jgi:hypothetical protein
MLSFCAEGIHKSTRITTTDFVGRGPFLQMSVFSPTECLLDATSLLRNRFLKSEGH